MWNQTHSYLMPRRDSGRLTYEMLHTHTYVHHISMYIYISSKVNIWNVNCARETAFIFDSRTERVEHLEKENVSTWGGLEPPTFGLMPNALLDIYITETIIKIMLIITMIIIYIQHCIGNVLITHLYRVFRISICTCMIKIHHNLFFSSFVIPKMEQWL